MKYSADDLSRAGDKYIGTPYIEMDCQAFVERCMADVGYARNLAGSNAWYRAMSWTGSPEDCIEVFGEVPKGAFLFILKDSGEPAKYQGDGIGNASHIGLKTGRGDGAIHSSSSRGMVCTSKFADKTIRGGWNRVGLLDVFDYGRSINWVLEHGGADPAPTDGGEPMTGKVFAENGGTVKLRAKPSTDCPYYEDIPVGTPVRILETGDKWSKLNVNGKTGWMKNEFIQTDEVPEDDFGPGDLDCGMVTITISQDAAAMVYPVLMEICRQIGRG